MAFLNDRIGRALSIVFGLCLLLVSQLSMAADKPDVRVLIDISGSMKENDPNNLRVPALNLLVDLLPEGSKAGVWTFGEYVNLLVPHEGVGDDWRRDARSRSRDITSSAMFTDIENALERSTYDAKRSSAGYDRHIILLTDGLVDISEAGSERQKRIENNRSRDDIQFDLLPQLQKAGFTIHTVALSDNADKDLMLKLAQRTGGLAAVANNAEELMQLFVQALDRTAPSEQVPLENNRFLVDSSINEFTALVFHKPNSKRVFLISPSGKRYTALDNPDNIRWHYETHYDLVTVTDPEDGEWLIETEMHPENRVTVVSDLSLQASDVPATLFRGLSLDIEASITEEGEVITRPEFLKVMTLNAEQVSDADQVMKSDVLTGKPGNVGYFETKLGPFNQVGNYRIKVNLDGKTFQRSISQPVSVQDIVSTTVDYDEGNDPTRVFFTKVLPELNARNVQITASVEGLNLQAALASQESWTMKLPELNRDKEQVIRLFAKGTVDGQNLDVELEPIVIPSRNPEPKVSSLEQDSSVEPQALPSEDTGAADSGAAGAGDDEPAPKAEKKKERMNLLDPNDQPLDPRPGGSDLLWVYIAVGLANIALFAGAFWLYRRFVQRRTAARQQKEEARRDNDLSL